MEAVIYDTSGKESGKISLPKEVFDVMWNSDLVHQVVTAMQSNARNTVAHAKDRSEKRGGGRKPWRQKGTGRARHGSRRSPIWVGGGVTHGPLKDRNFTKKTTKKMRTKALYIALSQKLRDGEIMFVDSISFDQPKTADAIKTMNNLGKVKGFEGLLAKKHNAVLMTLMEKGEATVKSMSNIGNVEVDETRNLNPVSVLRNKYVVITNPKESISFLESKKA